VWKFVQQMYGGGPAIVQDMYFPVVALSNRKMEIPVVGIINPMNLCFMISVVQCLFSNQHFAHYFLKKY
jgi:ubiquitin C-terminal hydrolase